MIENYLQELYKLYTEPPFLTYDKLAQYISENYNIEINYMKLREFILEYFPNISEIRMKNKVKFKGKWNPIFTETQLQELNKLYTEPPFLTYEKLVQHIGKNYNIEINYMKLREFILENFPNISEIRIENKVKYKEKWNPIFTQTQLQELYKLFTTPPYLDYKMLVDYSYKVFKIVISKVKLRAFMSDAFPNISKERKAVKNELYFYKEGKTISADEKGIIIELLAEGYTQTDVASLVNISRPHVNRIFKKSKIEIEEVMKNRILNKFSNIDINDIEMWWIETPSATGIYNKCVRLGCNIQITDIKYVLKNILNVSKKCKICGKEMKLFEATNVFCGNKCKKEAKQDSVRTQQHNRRVKGGGKIAQVVSRFAKIQEANGLCYLCGEIFDAKIKDRYHPLYVVLDHVEALTHSNDSSKDNLKPVCRCCNTMKSDKSKDYYSMEQYKNNKKIKVQQYTTKVDNYDLIDTEQFIIDCNNGMTTKKLCKKYNRSNPVIWKHKKNLGLQKKQKIHNRLDEEYATQEVTRLTKEGKTISEIAEILKISEPTVSNYRKRAVLKGILEAKDKRPGALQRRGIEQIINLLKEGKSNKEISLITKVSVSTAWKYRKRLIDEGKL